jgi:predicted amidophosphoribosyltransferase
MTKTQTKLDLKERRKNVKNAFALRPGNCSDVSDRLTL